MNETSKINYGPHILMGSEALLITFSMIGLSLENAIRVKWGEGSGLKGGDL